jgi:hypothetical protein
MMVKNHLTSPLASCYNMETMSSRLKVKKVIVVLAAPRTGSNYLFRLLTATGHFMASTGDETPFYRRAGLGIFNGSNYDDVIAGTLDDETLYLAGEELLADVGFREDVPQDPEVFISRILARMALQWPHAISLTLIPKLHRFLMQNLKLMPPHMSWRDFYISCLDKLQKLGLKVDSQMLLSTGTHPLELALLEEPPYVVPEPQRPPNDDDFNNHPLLLKTNTNIYRLPLLAALFPNAEFRFIVLTRNPLATTSSLMDGWLSSGFHSHNVSSTDILQIQGYSDTVPGGDRFWKFDMPPDWQNFKKSTLAQVALFQWHSANQAIANFISTTGNPVFQLKYEDLAFGQQQAELIAKLLEFSGAATSENIKGILGNSSIPANPPLAGKWKKRKQVLFQTITPETLMLAQKFDYAPGEMEEWL